MSSLALVLASFLLGAVPFSLLVGSWWCGVDLRTVGSRNPGATNLLRSAGTGPALLALLLDLGKGALPVYAALRLEATPAVVGSVAAAAVAGHVFPPYLAFRGGKGVATAVGALGPLAPAAVGAGLGLFAVVVAWTRWVSLGSIALLASIPVLAVLLGRLGWATPVEAGGLAASCLVAVLVIARHSRNVARLLAGTERRIGEPVEVGR
jgi:glycerol-3-phosphate acyltransferase PlsY